VTDVAAPGEADDVVVERFRCACGRTAAVVLVFDDDSVSYVVRCSCGSPSPGTTEGANR
jgi:hypothetical protein